MKRNLVTLLTGALLAVCLVPSAQASSFLSIQVGATTVSCNNTGACGAGFTTVLNSNTIDFVGTVAGIAFESVSLTSNSPGTSILAFATDTKTVITNTTGSAALITISFAANDFSLPAGSTVSFNAAQGMDAISSSVGLTQNFTGWGNGANTLALVGSTSVTPACNTATAPPTNTCSTNGPVSTFARSGNFALAGQEIVNLAAGATINSHGSVTATATTTAVPEPLSLTLLGVGLGAVSLVLRRKK